MAAASCVLLAGTARALRCLLLLVATRCSSNCASWAVWRNVGLVAREWGALLAPCGSCSPLSRCGFVRVWAVLISTLPKTVDQKKRKERQQRAERRKAEEEEQFYIHVYIPLLVGTHTHIHTLTHHAPTYNPEQQATTSVAGGGLHRLYQIIEIDILMATPRLVKNPMYLIGPRPWFLPLGVLV
jgi:hypothetical protein